MSREALEERGVFLPEDARGTLPVESSISPLWYVGTAIGALGAVVFMVLGGGGPTTWWAALVFAGFSWALTVVSFRAVDVRVRQLREAGKEPEEGEGPEEAPAGTEEGEESEGSGAGGEEGDEKAEENGTGDGTETGERTEDDGSSEKR